MYRQATRNSHREWQYHRLHVYNCILLKMSTWGSKYVEENNSLWINNNQCIKLVINIPIVNSRRTVREISRVALVLTYSGSYVRSSNVTFFSVFNLQLSDKHGKIQTIHHWCKNLAFPRSQTCRKFHYSQYASVLWGGVIFMTNPFQTLATCFRYPRRRPSATIVSA